MQLHERDFNSRAVTIDQYRNYALEVVFLLIILWFGMKNTFSGGVRFIHGSAYRRANGKNDGTD